MEKRIRTKINVTAEDIRLGMPGHCEKCAIARAARRDLKLPANQHVWVDEAGIRAIDSAHYTRVFLNPTAKMKRFINRFDNLARRKHLKPTTLQFTGIIR